MNDVEQKENLDSSIAEIKALLNDLKPLEKTYNICSKVLKPNVLEKNNKKI